MTLSRRDRKPVQAAPRAPANAARRGRRGISLVLLGLALAWALAATWAAVEARLEIGRLTDEAAVQRAAADDRVRALTRRLVGVASHGMLEQEGLADRLVEIIARQVELENRQAAVASLAERAAALLPGAASAGLGPPPDPAAAKRGASLADPAGRRIEEARALPLREKFDRLETALAALDAGQVRTVVGLAVAFGRIADAVRGVLADLTLGIVPPADRPPRSPAPAGRPDVFATQAARAEAAFEEAGRWNALAEAVPLLAPLEGSVPTSNFGTRKDPFTGAVRAHAGMDFRSPVGTPVRTAGRGRVTAAGPGGGYGNLVEIDHGNGLATRYAHLSVIGVAVDQPVAAGAVVGQVGSTGRSTGPHLHYETRLAGAPLDPARFIAAGQRLRGRPASAQAPQETPAEAADD